MVLAGCICGKRSRDRGSILGEETMIASLETDKSSEQLPKSSQQAQPTAQPNREQSAEVEGEDVRDEFEYQRKLFFGK